MRINKTIKNLELVWKQLDNSCGELENALFNLSSMKNLDENIQNNIERNSIVFSEIVSLKNQIEELIEQKKKNQSINDDWHFIHDELECSKCSNNEITFHLKYYEGMYNNQDAQKYICSNPECNFEEIKTHDELYNEEYGNKLD